LVATEAPADRKPRQAYMPRQLRLTFIAPGSNTVIASKDITTRLVDITASGLIISLFNDRGAETLKVQKITLVPRVHN
jgi:hypothetical protein